MSGKPHANQPASLQTIAFFGVLGAAAIAGSALLGLATWTVLVWLDNALF